jgi:hypothetical protein
MTAINRAMQQPIQIATGTGTLVSGLIRTMTLAHLVQIETVWRGMLVEAQQPDIDWSWAYKLRLATNEPRYEAYVVEIEQVAHGVMLLETEWHRSWLDGPIERRIPLVYVEYLASAPWNRRLIEDPPSFVGIGKSLLVFARQRSVEMGYGGRVGLHSLPTSETFYQRQGMPDYGADPDKDGLVYFEYGILQE